MTEEEMRKLADDLRRFARLYVGDSTYTHQFANTAFFIDVTADRIRRQGQHNG